MFGTMRRLVFPTSMVSSTTSITTPVFRTKTFNTEFRRR
jgi:hypothetical protein